MISWVLASNCCATTRVVNFTNRPALLFSNCKQTQSRSKNNVTCFLNRTMKGMWFIICRHISRTKHDLTILLITKHGELTTLVANVLDVLQKTSETIAFYAQKDTLALIIIMTQNAILIQFIMCTTIFTSIPLYFGQRKLQWKFGKS